MYGRWRGEEIGPPDGWDFGHLADRILVEEPPWDFPAVCRYHLAMADSALDLGTGGGEQLIRLLDGLPPGAVPGGVVATEGWPPNVPVAARALAPHRVPVVFYDADGPAGMPLPFRDGRFDLILDRHGSYDAKEVARVLGPGGVFLTQQVGGDDLPELRDAFGLPSRFPPVRLNLFADELAEAGLTVTDRAEWHGRHDFRDVGALVAYLQLVPWAGPPDFAVERWTDTLIRMHRAGPALGRPITATQSRFLLRAAKAG